MITIREVEFGIPLLGIIIHSNFSGLSISSHISRTLVFDYFLVRAYKFDDANVCFSSFGSKGDEEADDVINIFSLASGHLYERFIKIMMLSVIKNTKTPVKFWFLKNYLSPTLKVSGNVFN